MVNFSNTSINNTIANKNKSYCITDVFFNKNSVSGLLVLRSPVSASRRCNSTDNTDKTGVASGNVADASSSHESAVRENSLDTNTNTNLGRASVEATGADYRAMLELHNKTDNRVIEGGNYRGKWQRKLVSRLRRFEAFAFLDSHIGIGYPAPVTLSYSWSFGSLAGLCLVSQILTGLFLSMSYTGHMDYAFDSIEYMSREIPLAVMLRYLHANGASMFFVFIYTHIFRSIWHQSYLRNRVAWYTGVFIYFLAMGIAFLGYVLPYGQMSYWGATVITNLLTVLPYGLGDSVVEWMWGGFSVGGPTLTRFYSWHYLLPLVLLVVVVAHLLLLHETGSTSPSVARPIDGAPVGFYPMYFTKDLVTLIGFVFVTAVLAFFFPDMLGHPDNYLQANPYVTPAHIVPEWYFLPFYAILRAVPHKVFGVLAMVFAILAFIFLPILSGSFHVYMDPTPGRYARLWLLNFVALGYLGACPAEYPYVIAAQFCTFLYFFLLWYPIHLVDKKDKARQRMIKEIHARRNRKWVVVDKHAGRTKPHH